MSDVSISLDAVSKEELVRILKATEEKYKKDKEQFEKEKAEMEMREKKLNEALIMHKETLDKVRFPGINKSELPSNSTIAETLGIDPAELDFFLEKHPEKYLLKIEGASSAQIQALKMNLKDAEVNLSGDSIVELMEEQNDIFWSQYTTSSSIDEKFMENMEKAKAAYLKMKEQYLVEKRYLADVSLIQDCRMSAYLHYRDAKDATNELTEKIPEKEVNPELVELRQQMDTMKQELSNLKKEKAEVETKEVEKVQEESQKALASIGEGEVKEEEVIEDQPEPAEEPTPTEEERPKRPGRPPKTR